MTKEKQTEANGWQKDVKGQQKGKSFERKDSTKDNKISLLRDNFLEIIYLTEKKMFIFYSLYLFLLPVKQQIMTYNVKLRVCFDGIQMQYQRAVFLLLPQTTIFCVRLFCRSYPFLPKDRKSIVNGWQTDSEVCLKDKSSNLSIYYPFAIRLLSLCDPILMPSFLGFRLRNMPIACYITR